MRFLLSLFLTLGFVHPLAAAASAARPAPVATTLDRVQEQRAPITILISVDGLGADRLGKGLTPRLDELAAAGSHGSMRPSFPTNTFPNHITLATGLRPDHHGIVDQKMRDPALPGVTFRNTDPYTNRDPFWWNQIDPIWLQAERAGIHTATMLWVSSDVAINEKRPSDWWTYDSAITSARRVDMLVDWARRPPANRPQFMMLYFDIVDQASHRQGYGSPHEIAAIQLVDSEIGRLTDELAAMGQPANYVIVSDHGMVPVPPENIRPITDVVDKRLMEAITEGPLLAIFPKPGKERATTARLRKPPPHLNCWQGKDLPARLHFGTNARTPPWLCLADAGYSFVENPRPFTKGEHGFDPDTPGVAATFIVNGPAFVSGQTIARFDNVDVYALLCRLIGLTPQPSDGSIDSLASILQHP